MLGPPAVCGRAAVCINRVMLQITVWFRVSHKNVRYAQIITFGMFEPARDWAARRHRNQPGDLR